jgi:hypothetical protein
LVIALLGQLALIAQALDLFKEFRAIAGAPISRFQV